MHCLFMSHVADVSTFPLMLKSHLHVQVPNSSYRQFQLYSRHLSTETLTQDAESEGEHHSIITDTERSKGWCVIVVWVNMAVCLVDYYGCVFFFLIFFLPFLLPFLPQCLLQAFMHING